MANLRREDGAFWIFLLFGFTSTLVMSMILRTIGQTSQSVHQALTPGAIFVMTLTIYTGFILPTRNMQGWLRWINYINPIGYAYESLIANELSNRQFPCTEFAPNGPTYENISPLQRTCLDPGAFPGADFVDGNLYIEVAFGFYRSHIWRYVGCAKC